MNLKLVAAIILVSSSGVSANASPITLYCDSLPGNYIQAGPIVMQIDLEERELYWVHDSGVKSRLHEETFSVSPLEVQITSHGELYILDRRSLDFTIKGPIESISLAGTVDRKISRYSCSLEVKTKI